MKPRYIILLAALCATQAYADEPANYYSSCENKGGSALLKALCEKVGPHTTVSYDDLLELYKTSDVYPDGTLWDMYSTKHWSPSARCGNYAKVGDCYNREHSFPKSWFNDAKPMYSDAFHLYPTDGKVNGQRSNYPYGECANGTRLAANGGVTPLGKLGQSTFPGYSGKVFEPDDEYKGDFARSYFYMAAAYNDKISNWSSDMLARNSYPAFSSWAIELLLKWHRQDPVSEKEIDRNDVVYGRQRNRNPFIDHPEMAEYIWGNRKDQQWSYGAISEPEINSPADGTTLDFGTTAHGYKREISVTVRCTNLKDALSISTTGDFSASESTISAAKANAAAGSRFTVSFNASVMGNATGTLTLSSGNARSVLTLKGEVVDGLPAGRPTNITDNGFTASWTNIGDADNAGCYKLWVLYTDRSVVSGYPVEVSADDETYEVDNLDPATDYIYYMQSQSLKSKEYTFTTAEPIPSIDFYYDGELYLTANVGEPGEAAEIEAEIENISGDISLSVSAPFEISVDRSHWTATATLPDGADRLYVRLNGDEAGDYSSSLVARAADYFNDETVLRGSIGSVVAMHEDFEPVGNSDGSYSAHSYKGSACLWNFSDAGIWNDPAHDGERAARMGKTSSSYIEMAEAVDGGIGTVTLWAKDFNNDGSAEFELLYTAEGSDDWKSAGSAATTSAYKEFTFTVNQPGRVRLKVQQTSGKRWNLDAIHATNCRGTASVDDPDGYHSWDASCCGTTLTVRLAESAGILVYGTDGIIYHKLTGIAGDNTMELAPGLYLVAVNGRVRRVVATTAAGL